MNAIESLIDEYYKWLKDKTQLREVDNWVEITTPYLDRHNDYIQIYAKKNGDDRIVLTDDKATIHDLIGSGVNLATPKRKQMMNVILNGFGVELIDNALKVTSTVKNFSLKKHNLIQAILSIGDLFNTAQATVKSLFLEDVTGWLDENQVRYVPDVRFTGKTGYEFAFNFAIPKSPAAPERIVQAISSPNNYYTKNFILAWLDTKEIRPDKSKAFVILNDDKEKPKDDVLHALKSYEIVPVNWANRGEYIKELAA